MKAVRTRLGVTLNIPARSASDLYDLMARYSSCLLILDRCEDMIRNRRAPFLWFLSQLLQQSSVKVVISSQTPMDELEVPHIGDAAIQWSSLNVGHARGGPSSALNLATPSSATNSISRSTTCAFAILTSVR